MPNSASAGKRLRQNHSRRDANRATRSKLRTYIRRVQEATEAYEAAVAENGDTDAALATVNEAYRDAQIKIDKAGAVGIEIEVVPPKVAAIITKKVNILTLSMGSGSDCDGQYLFANDVLGYTQGHIPRHARVYRNFREEYEKLQKERVNAFKEYHDDAINKKFNDPKITVGIEDNEYEKFLQVAEKI